MTTRMLVAGGQDIQRASPGNIAACLLGDVAGTASRAAAKVAPLFFLHNSGILPRDDYATPFFVLLCGDESSKWCWAEMIRDQMFLWELDFFYHRNILHECKIFMHDIGWCQQGMTWPLRRPSAIDAHWVE